MNQRNPIQAQALPSAPPNNGEHEEWIAGRVEVLLSHYHAPNLAAETKAAAIGDWIDALAPFSQIDIERACAAYLRDQPRRRPTPGDIRSKIRPPKNDGVAMGKGDKSALTYDELRLLEDKVLPTARKWLTVPSLADHGRSTLAYWGEVA